MIAGITTGTTYKKAIEILSTDRKNIRHSKYVGELAHIDYYGSLLQKAFPILCMSRYYEYELPKNKKLANKFLSADKEFGRGLLTLPRFWAYFFRETGRTKEMYMLLKSMRSAAKTSQNAKLIKPIARAIAESINFVNDAKKYWTARKKWVASRGVACKFNQVNAPRKKFKNAMIRRLSRWK